jgi:hypothetical protein
VAVNVGVERGLTYLARLKCNRELPCQNCTARSEEASCKFRGAKNGAVTPLVPGRPSVDADATRQRIDHLEDLVKKLIAERQGSGSSPDVSSHSNSSGTGPSPESSSRSVPSPALQRIRKEPDVSRDVDGDSDGDDETVLDSTHSVYHGGGEWYAVLREVPFLSALAYWMST